MQWKQLMQTPKPAARGLDRNSSRNTWRSVANPSFQSQPTSTANTQTSQMEYIELLKREVELLRQQLQQSRNQTNFQTRTNQVQQADFQQTLRLQPRHTPKMALTPAATASVTMSYYVGDLMEPPFHTATLRLMQFIKANVAPDSWSDSHMMQITEPSISLTITQSRANHDQIAELLRQVRIGARSYMARPMRR